MPHSPDQLPRWAIYIACGQSAIQKATNVAAAVTRCGAAVYLQEALLPSAEAESRALNAISLADEVLIMAAGFPGNLVRATPKARPTWPPSMIDFLDPPSMWFALGVPKARGIPIRVLLLPEAVAEDFVVDQTIPNSVRSEQVYLEIAAYERHLKAGLPNRCVTTLDRMAGSDYRVCLIQVCPTDDASKLDEALSDVGVHAKVVRAQQLRPSDFGAAAILLGDGHPAELPHPRQLEFLSGFDCTRPLVTLKLSDSAILPGSISDLNLRQLSYPVRYDGSPSNLLNLVRLLVGYRQYDLGRRTVFDHDVFVSYSRFDIATVTTLVDALGDGGVNCWLDRKRLAPGDLLAPELDTGLLRSHHVIVCVSDNYAKTDWCMAEYAAAMNLSVQSNGKRRIFPVTVGPISDDSFALLNGIVRIDAARSDEVDNLIQKILNSRT